MSGPGMPRRALLSGSALAAALATTTGIAGFAGGIGINSLGCATEMTLWDAEDEQRLRRACGGTRAPAAGVMRESPDAELLSTCAAFDAIEARIGALDGDRDEALLVQLERERQPVLDRLCELRAGTSAGLRARASTLACYAPELLDPSNGYIDRRVLASLLRDLIDGGVA